ncbi:hypothetical protein ACYSNU_16730 [Enterococcus sp. LJL120]
MTEKNYLDSQGMQERADTEFQKKVEKSKDNFRKQRENDQKQREEVQSLFAKAILSERETAEKQRAVEVEQEKARAIAEVEARYEEKGVKSNDQLKKDAAYKSLLSGLTKSEK